MNAKERKQPNKERKMRIPNRAETETSPDQEAYETREDFKDLQVHEGTRGKPFKEFIKRLLAPILSKEYLHFLLTDECLKEFDRAFTSKLANPTFNYERYEQLGDVSVNKFIVNYMYHRFPQLDHPDGVDLVARLKIKYASKDQLQLFATNEGMWPFITCVSEERTTSNRQSLLEDVFEALCGVTESLIDNFVSQHAGGGSLTRKDNSFIGVGFHFVYQMLKNMFDKVDISLRYEDLVTAKTIFNELKSQLKQGTLSLETMKQDQDGSKWESEGIILWHGRREVLGRGVASGKKDAEEQAASNTLKVLKQKYNIHKNIPPRYRQFY